MLIVATPIPGQPFWNAWSQHTHSALTKIVISTNFLFQGFAYCKQQSYDKDPIKMDQQWMWNFSNAFILEYVHISFKIAAMH